MVTSLFLSFRKQDPLVEKDDLVQLKEAYKWIIHVLFLEELGVPADGKVS